MKPLAFLQSIPAAAVVSRRLDRLRSRRVDTALAGCSGDAREVRAACEALLERDDQGARELVDAVVPRFLAALREVSGGDGLIDRGAARIDEGVRSEALELLDRDGVPAFVKAFTMRLLHRVNAQVGSYDVWTGAVLEALGDRRDAHVYDLAAGTGGFARHLAKSPTPGRTLRITSTDLSPAYVALGEKSARAEGVEGVAWEVCDALDQRHLRARGGVDLMLCTQAAHHLSPGQLVRMISQSMHTASRGILVIDLMRGASTALGTLALTTVLAPWPPLVFDGFQSVRRAYTPAEFALLARLAGAGSVEARPLGPAWCTLLAQP